MKWPRDAVTTVGGGVAFAFCGGCGFSSAQSVAVVPAASFDSIQDTAKLARAWEMAFVRDGNLYLGKGDGHGARKLDVHASALCWSPDGKKLAYVRGSEVVVRDMRSGRSKVLLKSKMIGESTLSALQMSFDAYYPLLWVPLGNGIEVYDLRPDNWGESVTQLRARGESPVTMWVTGSICFSPSGKYFAFTRSGDVWLATRGSHLETLEGTRLGYMNPELYEDANRLAALAFFNDGETGASGRTPMWVDELAWRADEKRLYFHYNRQGGSGVSEIGYIDLVKVGGKFHDWAEAGAFKAEVHWLNMPVGAALNPRIGTDGKTFTFSGWSGEHNEDPEGLQIASADGKKRQLIAEGVYEFAWRPKAK